MHGAAGIVGLSITYRQFSRSTTVAPVPRAPGKNAEARQKTVLALLEAGVAMVEKTPADELLSQVRVRDVAQQAGVSPAAIYHYWPTQQAYRRAVVEYMLEPRRFRTRGELAPAVEQIDAETKRVGRVSIRGAVRAGARANIERIMGTQGIRLQMGLWARHDDEQVASLLKRMYDSLADDFIPLFEGLAALDGRRFRAPFNVRDFAVAIAALTEGFTLRWAVDPEGVPTDLPALPRLLDEPDDPEEPTWDLYSACVYFLAACMTEPDSKVAGRQ
jgi:AcrR family transcriptional regulator